MTTNTKASENKISIIMPAKNAGAFIKESIESILKQDYQDFEIIVIEDKSKDNTRFVVEQIQDSRIIILDGAGTGIADAFNLGLRAATGHYLCRCDADDLYPSNRLSIQIEFMKNNPDYVAVCGSHTAIDTNGQEIVRYQKDRVSGNIDEDLRKAITPAHFCSFMTLTAVLKKIGGCRGFFVTAEDIDLQLRLGTTGKVYFLCQNFYFYRLHDSSITHVQPSSQRHFYEKIARDSHTERLMTGTDRIYSSEWPTEPVSVDDATSASDHITNHLISESWYWQDKDFLKNSIAYAIKAVKKRPSEWKVWRNLFLIIVKGFYRKIVSS